MPRILLCNSRIEILRLTGTRIADVAQCHSPKTRRSNSPFDVFIVIAVIDNAVNRRIRIGRIVNGISIASMRPITCKRNGTILFAKCGIASKGTKRSAVRELEFKGVAMELVHFDKGGQIYVKNFFLVLAVHQGKTQVVVVI